MTEVMNTRPQKQLGGRIERMLLNRLKTKFLYKRYPLQWAHTSGVFEDHWHEPYRNWVNLWWTSFVFVSTITFLDITFIEMAALSLIYMVYYMSRTVSGRSHLNCVKGLSLALLPVYLVMGWSCYYTRTLGHLLLTTMVTTDSFIYMLREHFAPTPLYMKGGGIYGPPHKRVRLTSECRDNLCMWECLFENPRLAQYSLATRPDGKMTAQQVNEFGRSGLVSIYTPEGRLFSGAPSNGNNWRVVYISDGHARPYTPNGQEPKLVGDYNGPPVGIVFPVSVKFKYRPFPQLVEMEERVKNVWRYVDKTNLGMMAESVYIAAKIETDVLKELAMRPNPNSLSRTQLCRAYLTNPKRKIYNVIHNRWLWKTGEVYMSNSDNVLETKELPESVDPSCMVWTGKEICHCEWRDGRPFRFTNDNDVRRQVGEWIILVEDLPYRKGKAYLDRFDWILSLPEIHVPPSGFKGGVPSCGKSTDVVNLSTPTTMNSSPTAEGAQNLRDRGINSRTLDSLIVNGFDNAFDCETFVVDEGLMEHPGTILMCAQILKPKYIRVYGDKRQIHFIPRLPGYTPLHKTYPFTTMEPPMVNAYNNSKVVCDLLRALYGVYNWCGKHVGSLHLKIINNTETVGRGHEIYLTFTQVEKFMISRAIPGCDVMTIHEAQGRRWSDVALVRLNIFKIPVYSSTPHNIVAISRTNNKFSYYTVDKTDVMSTWLINNKASQPDAEKAEEELFKATPYVFKCNSNALTVQRPVRLNRVKPIGEFEDWTNTVKQVNERSRPDSLTFILQMPLPHYTPWLNRPGPAHSIQSTQETYDQLFRRCDKDIADTERTDWPVTWPEGVKADLVKSARKPAQSSREGLKNLCITTQPDRAWNHPLDVMQAIQKRVLDAPQLKEDYDPLLADELCKRVMDLLDTEKLDVLNCTMPLDNLQMQALWWNTRPEVKRHLIMQANLARSGDGTYFVIVRGDHKAKLDNSHPDSVPPGQLVTAMSPFWNSYFAPLFQTMLVKLLAVLPPNIVFCTRMTEEQKNAIIAQFLSGLDFKILEGDIEKYDKSQEYVFLMAQCKLFRHFGMLESDIDLWQTYHELCTLVSPKWGFRTTVSYQRRSGDPLTWFGNTLVLFMIMAYLYDLEECLLVLLNGDDNLLAWKPDYLIPEKSELAARKLNFSMKTFSLSDSMYFSSRFIIPTRFGFIAVADPVKLWTRLGRSDLRGREHLKAIHESWVALHYMYTDPEVRANLDQAAVARYNGILKTDVVTLMPIINTLSAIIADYSQLEKFFTGTEEQWNLKLDPSEKVGGGLYEKLVDVFVTDI